MSRTPKHIRTQAHLIGILAEAECWVAIDQIIRELFNENDQGLSRATRLKEVRTRVASALRQRFDDPIVRLRLKQITGRSP